MPYHKAPHWKRGKIFYEYMSSRMHFWLKRDADRVMGIVSDHFGLPVRTLRGRLRTPEAVIARAFAYYALRECLPLYMTQIAAYFNVTPSYISRASNWVKNAKVVSNMRKAERMRNMAWIEAKEKIQLPKFD